MHPKIRSTGFYCHPCKIRYCFNEHCPFCCSRNRLHAPLNSGAGLSGNLGGLIVPNVSVIRSDEPAEFAASVNGFEARYLPTTNDHGFVKYELSLGSGRLAVSTRPPMVYEGTVVANEGVVCFHLDDDLRANVNGHSVGADTIALWKKGTDYQSYQRSRLTHCALFVSDAFSAHDWPEPAPAVRIPCGSGRTAARICDPA